jgi:PIN domain
LFANRYTALADACSLAGVLKRNLLLTLAEAAFFRVRWSKEVLEETELAVADILIKKGNPDTEAKAKAAYARAEMERAFPEAMVSDFDDFLGVKSLPDAKDAHVIAAALKAQAATIVTENLRHFPKEILAPLNIEARSTDAFIADTIELNTGRAVAAIRRMREGFKRPEMTANDLLIKMEAAGLTETVDVLRPEVLSL